MNSIHRQGRERQRPRDKGWSVFGTARRWLLAAILVVAALLRFWRLGDVALIGDESYYWLWSERLAPSYYDNPAGVALMVRLSTLIGGQSEAGIRWLNALLGVSAVWLAYQLGTRLLSEPAALLAAALLAVGAPYLVLSRFVYTDALQLALLLLNLLTLLPFLPSEETTGSRPIPTWRFWAAAWSTAALLNSKYNAYLYALAMAAFLAIRRPSLLRDRRAWWAAGVTLLGLLPAVAWNAANGWVSYRWQLMHFAQATLHRSTPLGRAWHAVRYLTPPLMLVVLAGVAQACRTPRVPGAPQRPGARPCTARRQMLYVPALAFVLPIALSPTDSPRNLVNGATLLLLLGCDALWRWVTRLQQKVSIPAALATRSAFNCALALLLTLWAGVYGRGTILETLHPTTWPHSPVATAIRQDSLGWRDAPNLDLADQGWIFAVDYSIASQLRYYTGLPVQTAWGQYQLWGIPELEGPAGENQTVQIVTLSYIDPDILSERLRTSFSETTGPTPMPLREGREVKHLNVWTARGRRVDAKTFLETFDLLNLAQAGQAARKQQEARP